MSCPPRAQRHGCLACHVVLSLPRQAWPQMPPAGAAARGRCPPLRLLRGGVAQPPALPPLLWASLPLLQVACAPLPLRLGTPLPLLQVACAPLPLRLGTSMPL